MYLNILSTNNKRKTKTMKNFLKPNKTKIILSIVAIGIMIFSFSALAAWEVPGIPSGIVDKDLDEVVLDITSWLLGFAGILALLFIIWGGIQYTTAAGNENQMENAKKTVKWGIIGLVICGLSFAIIAVVVGVWMGGSSSSVSPCTLTASDLDTQAECNAAGCSWFFPVAGCTSTTIWGGGISDCGHAYGGPYSCSVNSAIPAKYVGEGFVPMVGCGGSWCCCP